MNTEQARKPIIGASASIGPTYVSIREYQPQDEERLVELSLRAWAPVFAATEHILGHEISARLHGNWQHYQENAVRHILANHAVQVWIAEAKPGIVGFVATALHRERLIGEILMLAVEPDDQDHGAGTALTEFATDQLRGAGMRVAMVETGGDPGHAPARRVYQKATYTPLPVARYFKAL